MMILDGDGSLFKSMQDEIKELQEQLKQANEVINTLSDPEHEYWIERTREVEGQKVYIMKDIQALSKMPRAYLEKYNITGKGEE